MSNLQQAYIRCSDTWKKKKQTPKSNQNTHTYAGSLEKGEQSHLFLMEQDSFLVAQKKNKPTNTKPPNLELFYLLILLLPTG